MKPTFVITSQNCSSLIVLLAGAILIILLSSASTTNAQVGCEPRLPFCSLSSRFNKTRSEPKIVKALYNLAGKLFAQLNRQNKQHDNIIVSPVSIQLALSTLYLGSDANSQTRRELQNVMGYTNMRDSEIRQCNEEYALLMAEFQQITSEAMNETMEFETEKRAANMSQSSIDGNRPRSYLVEPFTMLVMKNQRSHIRPDYVKDAARYYNASIRNVDDRKPKTKSALISRIDKWTKEAGFVRPMIDRKALDDKFEALLLSSIRYERFWDEDFADWRVGGAFYNYGREDQLINGACFYTKMELGMSLIEFTSYERARVDFLHDIMSKDAIFQRLSRLNFLAFKYDLKDDLTFAIFEPVMTPVPHNTTIPQLNELISNLFSAYDVNGTSTNLEKAFELMDRDEHMTKVDRLQVPGMKFESEINLRAALESIGLTRIFDRERSELSNITSARLHISGIKHKARIHLTKSGLQVPGPSASPYIEASVPDIDATIKRPFFFVIRHDQIPLFVGQFTHM